MAGWLDRVAAAGRRPSLLWRSYGGSVYPPELAAVVARAPAERRPDDRAGRGRGVADRASVDRRDRHAGRHGRHLDRQLRRRRPRRLVGARRRLHADRDGRGVPARPGAARRRADRASRLIAVGLGARRDLDAPRRRGRRRRVYESVGARRALTAAVGRRVHVRHRRAGTSPRTAMNSFPQADEEVLERDPRAAAHRGAPRAPRIRGASTSSARRCRSCAACCRRVQVQLHRRRPRSGSSSRPAQHYGEIWYELGGRRAMSRVTTAEGVLETIYELAGMTPPAGGRRGRSSAGIRSRCRRSGAAAVFYGIWPALVVAVGMFFTRRHA